MEARVEVKAEVKAEVKVEVKVETKEDLEDLEGLADSMDLAVAEDTGIREDMVAEGNIMDHDAKPDKFLTRAEDLVGLAASALTNSHNSERICFPNLMVNFPLLLHSLMEVISFQEAIKGFEVNSLVDQVRISFPVDSQDIQAVLMVQMEARVEIKAETKENLEALEGQADLVDPVVQGVTEAKEDMVAMGNITEDDQACLDTRSKVNRH